MVAFSGAIFPDCVYAVMLPQHHLTSSPDSAAGIMSSNYKQGGSTPVAGEISASFSQPTKVAGSQGSVDLTLSSKAKKFAPCANIESICSR